MKKAIVFLVNGFEEVEATGTVDILRRGGIDTKTVSITDDRKVTGAHNMEYTADATFTEIDLLDVDALILPGSMSGASNLNNLEPVKEALLRQYREGRIVAVIYAAPMVLGGLGLLKGCKVTCYPEFEPRLIGATVTGEAVEVDGNTVTSRGPGLVSNFGLVLVFVLKGDAVAEEVTAGLLSQDLGHQSKSNRIGNVIHWVMSPIPLSFITYPIDLRDILQRAHCPILF